MPDEASPVVLVLGDFAHEGLTAKIESLGFTVLNKRFRSTPRNWEKIVDSVRSLSEEGRLPLVFGYLPTPTVLLIAEEQYDGVRERLFEALEGVPTTFFVFEDNLDGQVEPLPWEMREVDDEELEQMDVPWRTEDLPWSFRPLDRDEWFERNGDRVERGMEILNALAASSVDVLPFRKRSDVTIRMFEALEDAQAGIFLRLYVPHGRYQSEQLEDFLTLFTRYLRDVEGKEFSVDVKRTRRGTTYIFRGQGDASTLDDIRTAIARFDSFLVLVESDSAAAERALVSAGASPEDAGFVVAKYARSFRRLQLETKHEFERRSLQLVQALEAEVIELDGATLPPTPTDERPSALLSVVGNMAPITVNIGSTTVALASGATVFNAAGDIEYTAEDRQLISMIEGVQDELAAMQLRSDLDRLKDPATSPEERKTGVQKLKAFVYKAALATGKKVGEVGTHVLIAYLTSLVTAPPTK